MPLHVDQAEDLVQPGDDGELLGLDRLDPRPVHQLDEVVLYLAPVGLQAGLGVDLLGPQVPRDGRGLVEHVAVEGVGERMGGVGAHHEGPASGPGGFDGGGGRDRRLAHAALSGEEQDSHPHLA